MTPGDFFEDEAAPAVLKHGILKRYLRPFVTKVGRYTPRVVYLDGYAGPGQYASGRPGSPAIAAETAEKIGAIRELWCLFVEKDPDEFQALDRLFASDPRCITKKGAISDHLAWALQQAGDAPLFAFLDPFGRSDLPLSRIVDEILARDPITEVMLNFSGPGFWRIAGHLTSDSANASYLKTKRTSVRNLDSSLGGDWWQAIWESHYDRPPHERRTDNYLNEIVAGYRAEINRRTGGRWGGFSVPVAPKWQGSPVYYLLFFTMHPDGMWLFNECLSSATQEYRAFLDAEEERRQGPQQRMFVETHEDRVEQWVDVVRSNMVALLDDGPVPLAREMARVYGSTLGQARETHLRAALNQLYEAGVTITNPRGQSLQRLTVSPASDPR